MPGKVPFLLALLLLAKTCAWAPSPALPAAPLECEKGDWLHFRAAVTHALRAEPSVDSPLITRIALDHKLELLELRGDWMRVRVSQPDWTCAGSEQEFRGTVHVGWVKWRDAKTGPWLWYYTRGC